MNDSHSGQGNGTRKASTARTRALIVETARKLFSAVVSAVPSVADIASAAGLAPGTIYVHFASKADLLATVIQETRSPPIPDMAEFAGVPRRELFETIARMVTSATAERGEFLMSLAADAVRRPEMRSDFYGATLERPYRSAAELIGRLPECAELIEEDVAALAHILLNACIFTTIEQSYLGGSESDPVDPDRLSRIVGALAVAALASLPEWSEAEPSEEDSPPTTRKSGGTPLDTDDPAGSARKGSP